MATIHSAAQGMEGDGLAHRQAVTTQSTDVEYLRKQVMALVGLLSRKGVVRYGEFLDEVHRLEEVDHQDGARVVARAWTDPAYKERLLRDPKAAVAELGIEVGGYQRLEVLENTEQTHHVVVCTTCSCVPSPLSGFTPDWYKSTVYRTRIVSEPRDVLRDFGLELPEDVEVRVVDTDQQRRCLVLPKWPAGAEGLTEEQLAALVTQESLFGVGQPKGPIGA
ncbi:MAG: nitrile hydratase subunit alpha [Chloroflexota bacterium]